MRRCTSQEGGRETETNEGGKEIAALYAGASGRLRVSRVALLVNKDAYERAMAYLKEAQGYGVNVIVFSVPEVACTWLGVDSEIVRTELNALQSRSSHSDSSTARS